MKKDRTTEIAWIARVGNERFCLDASDDIFTRLGHSVDLIFVASTDRSPKSHAPRTFFRVFPPFSPAATLSRPDNKTRRLVVICLRVSPRALPFARVPLHPRRATGRTTYYYYYCFTRRETNTAHGHVIKREWRDTLTP